MYIGAIVESVRPDYILLLKHYESYQVVPTSVPVIKFARKTFLFFWFEKTHHPCDGEGLEDQVRSGL